MNHLATPFRLFFAAAGLMACIVIVFWYLLVAGHLQVEMVPNPVMWHAHEMIFGYFGAVLVGFLLTAAASWTSLPTVGMRGTLALLMLWGLARLVHAAGWQRFPASTYLEGALFAAAALGIAIPIVRSRRWKNLVFVLVLLAMAVGDVLMHLAAESGVSPDWGYRGLWLGIDSVAVAILVFGGRIIPLFTKNALQLPSVRGRGLVDALGLIALFGVMAAHLASASAHVEAACMFAAGALTLARLYGWGGLQSLRRPLLAVLHLGWASVGVGMLLVGVALVRPLQLPLTAAHHALYIGGFGVLSLGMMARVALGHTGRKRVASRGTTFAFVCLGLAAAGRVCASLLEGEAYVYALLGATVLWVLAFAFFLGIYTPILFRSRPDGKAG